MGDIRCYNDTDGDGNCHKCHRYGGCSNYGPCPFVNVFNCLPPDMSYADFNRVGLEQFAAMLNIPAKMLDESEGGGGN